MNDERPIRVLIADDHPIVRHGLTSLLRANPPFHVVGEAADGLDALSTARTTAPDLVVMDIAMPRLDGIETTRRLAGERPELAIVMLTMFDDDASLFAALRAGARGYLLKGAPHDDVLHALRACANGDVVFGAPVARQVLTYFAARHEPRPEPPFPELTARERQILELMAHGTDNATIATRLDVAAKTIRNHASNIFTKLHVADRTEAVLKARDNGLGR